MPRSRHPPTEKRRSRTDEGEWTEAAPCALNVRGGFMNTFLAVLSLEPEIRLHHRRITLDLL